MSVDLSRRAAYLAHRQGLDGSLNGASPEQVLLRAGWARSVGGANPYITLFSRAGISREAADRAVKELHIHELPSARGCTYVLPAEHFALGLALSRGFGGEPEVASAKKHLGVTDEELDKLDQGILTAIAVEAKDPKVLREDLGELVRNLGEGGKKRGVTTTLPLSLGRLQQQGKIRRVPIGGRLDQQRYAYIAWANSPVSALEAPSEPWTTQCARLFWSWIGLASLDHFKWFTGLSLKACKEATSGLNLCPAGSDGQLLILPELQDEWMNFRTPEGPNYRFTSALDSIVLLRRSLDDALDEVGQSRAATLSKDLMDLESHPILDRGRIVGLWEYDGENHELVWRTWQSADSDLLRTADEFQTFIREQLGDARSFSLDSPSSRRAQIEKVKAISVQPDPLHF